jgi:hypothetical protein
MVEAQAQRITKLNDQIKQLKAERDRIRFENENIKVAANYYMNMQKMIQNSEAVMEAWKDFLLVLHIHDSDADAKISGWMPID